MRKLIHNFNLKLQKLGERFISLYCYLLEKGDNSILFAFLSVIFTPLFLLMLWLLGGLIITVDTIDMILDYGGDNDAYRTK